MTIRRLLIKWPHLHELWVKTWELEKERTFQAHAHGPVGTLRRILHRWPWEMKSPWNLLTDKDLPAHLLKAPRGWLRGQGEAAAQRSRWAKLRSKTGATKREDLRGL